MEPWTAAVTGVEVEDVMNLEVAATEDVLVWTMVKDSGMEGEVDLFTAT